MSALHVYVIACDAPACGVRFARELSRADETRMHAAREGWVHGRVPPSPNKGGPTQSLDYCPAHAEFAEGLHLPSLPTHAREVTS